LGSGPAESNIVPRNTKPAVDIKIAFTVCPPIEYFNRLSLQLNRNPQVSIGQGHLVLDHTGTGE
jgi:hypothetical protein